MRVSSTTTNLQPSRDSLGKKTWVDVIFYQRITSQMSLSGEQENAHFDREVVNKEKLTANMKGIISTEQ